MCVQLFSLALVEIDLSHVTYYSEADFLKVVVTAANIKDCRVYASLYVFVSTAVVVVTLPGNPMDWWILWVVLLVLAWNFP